MNSSKTLSIILFLFSLGVLKETHRIATSNDLDIVRSRSSLLIMSALLTSVIVYFAIKLWIKGTREK